MLGMAKKWVSVSPRETASVEGGGGGGGEAWRGRGSPSIEHRAWSLRDSKFGRTLGVSPHHSA